MRLAALVVLTMTAFAANSVLNRIGVWELGMNPLDFAAIRVAAGAAMLWLLMALRRAPRPGFRGSRRWAGALALALYMLGFSWAYQSLDTGIGALILFGALQVVIFGWSVRQGQHIPALRWLGAGVALAGLSVLLWPGEQIDAPSAGAAAMLAAAFGWAVYTLLGRGEPDALGGTAANFALCLPLAIGFAVLAGGGPLTIAGIVTACIAGAVTSGLGYALWYRVLPQMETTTAGIAQLSVPVIAVAAGVLLLGETLSPRALIAAAMVLGGIALSLRART